MEGNYEKPKAYERAKGYCTKPKTLDAKTLGKMYPADQLELFVETENT